MSRQKQVGVAERTRRILTYAVVEHPQVVGADEALLGKAREGIVTEAEKFALRGVPYGVGPGKMVCTDVYVFACRDAGIPLSKSINDHFAQHGREVYPQTDLRYVFGVRHLKLAWDAVRRNAFNNSPENEFFPRRLQNVMAFMASNGVLWDRDEVERGQLQVKPGMLVFWSQKNPDLGTSRFPMHVGVVDSVTDQGEIGGVIHASFSQKKVIKCPHSQVLGSMDLVAVGDLPLSVLKK